MEKYILYLFDHFKYPFSILFILLVISFLFGSIFINAYMGLAICASIMFVVGINTWAAVDLKQ